MAGKRQHTTPRFILKGFASSRRGDEIYVWMYRKGRAGIELNIKNVGVEKDSYGKAVNSDLDDRITALEPDFAGLVDQLRTRPTPDAPLLTDTRIPRLIAHLSLRTRQLRQSVLALTDTMLQGLKEQLSQRVVVRAALQRELGRKGDFQNRLRAQMIEAGYSPDQVELRMAHLQAHLPVVLEQLMPLFRPQFTKMLDEFISLSRSILPEAMKAGFIDSMSRNLNAEKRVENYAKHNWFIVNAPSPVLLGDTVCLFETTGSRRFKPLDDGNDDVQRIYLPLAPNRVLIGTPYTSLPPIDPRLLNDAIARCSYEFMVSSEALPSDSPLIRDLGRWSGVLSQKELRELMADLRRDFLEN